ncbi:MAG: hypothetical protein KC543_05540 [Myxococcales bacterium]|nr:hypothetical protein [Myxococcales bacterium]
MPHERKSLTDECHQPVLDNLEALSLEPPRLPGCDDAEPECDDPTAEDTFSPDRLRDSQFDLEVESLSGHLA